MNVWSRRGTIGAGVLAVLGGIGLRLHPFGRHYAPTPYDDLINRLVDRDAGARVGDAILIKQPAFDIRAAAMKLRASLRGQNLATLASEDIRTGRMREAGGWMLPESLALLCAVTAKA